MEDEMIERVTGKVKWFKGVYGFIIVDNDKEFEEVFVHQNELSGFRTLNPGQRVVFEIGDTAKGKQARKVTVIEQRSFKEIEEKKEIEVKEDKKDVVDKEDEERIRRIRERQKRGVYY